MTNTILCKKLGEQQPALDFPPYPGEMGQKIFTSISKPAWDLWLGHQTMLINEYRLNMLDTEARSFLAQEMEKFLFGDGSETPSGYNPPKK
jgi:Fe-S cluster biosynthesis and repair protein YggX